MTTWTAPQSGWYQFGDGEPRLLADSEVDTLGLADVAGDSGTATVVKLDSMPAPVGWVPAEANLILGDVEATP